MKDEKAMHEAMGAAWAGDPGFEAGWNAAIGYFFEAIQARKAKLRLWIKESPVVIVRDNDIDAAKRSKQGILALPLDDSALLARLKAERERCISVVFGQCESDNVAQRTAEAIRALPEEV